MDLLITILVQSMNIQRRLSIGSSRLSIFKPNEHKTVHLEHVYSVSGFLRRKKIVSNIYIKKKQKKKNKTR